MFYIRRINCFDRCLLQDSDVLQVFSETAARIVGWCLNSVNTCTKWLRTSSSEISAVWPTMYFQKCMHIWDKSTYATTHPHSYYSICLTYGTFHKKVNILRLSYRYRYRHAMGYTTGVLRYGYRHWLYCLTEVEARQWYSFGETIQDVNRFWNRCRSHWEEKKL